MSVDIKIDLKTGQAHAKIGELYTSLKGLEHATEDLDIDFDTDIGEIGNEIDRLKDSLNDLDRNLKNIRGRLRSLDRNFDGGEFDVMHRQPDGSTGSGDSTGGDPPDRAGRASQFASRMKVDFSEFADAQFFSNDEIENMEWKELQKQARKRDVYPFGAGKEDLRRNLKRDSGFDVSTGRVGFESGSKSLTTGTKAAGINMPGGGKSSTTDLFTKDPNYFKKIKRRFGGIGTAAKRAVPNMNQVYQVIAAIIPLAVVLGAQLLGVAAAMGAVAAAGVAIGGLGLLGHGDSMQESFANAKQELSDLKDNLFEAAQPSMRAFAPIQSRMFDAIPGRISQIAEELKGLRRFEDTLFTLGAMLAGGLEYSLRAIAENEQAISQLTLRFADIVGTEIIEFFGWLFEEARANQNMLISLGSVLKDIATVVFRVFRVLVMLLDAFSPITAVVLRLSSLLENRLVQGLLVFAGTAYLTMSVISKLGVAALSLFKTLSLFWAGSTLATLKKFFAIMHFQVSSLIFEYTALNATLATTLSLLAMTGIGAIGIVAGGAALAGFMGGNSGGGGGGSPGVGGGMGTGGGGRGGQVYNDNRQYTINAGGSADDYATLKDVEDTVRRTDRAGKAQSRPAVESDAESSD